MADQERIEALREMARIRGFRLVKSRRRKRGGDRGKFGLTDLANRPGSARLRREGFRGERKRCRGLPARAGGRCLAAIGKAAPHPQEIETPLRPARVVTPGGPRTKEPRTRRGGRRDRTSSVGHGSRDRIAQGPQRPPSRGFWSLNITPGGPSCADLLPICERLTNCPARDVVNRTNGLRTI